MVALETARGSPLQRESINYLGSRVRLPDKKKAPRKNGRCISPKTETVLLFPASTFIAAERLPVKK
jgi:hypothetical protein